jgi:isoquinoline 1-oxidoreductase alpha subunit
MSPAVRTGARAAGPAETPDLGGNMVAFTLNGKPVSVEAEPETPLLWVLREHVKLTGTKYGCGAGLCGACTVHVNGEAVKSCLTQAQEIAGKQVTTIEGLSADSSHPLQKAWIAEQVPQCGYCQSGQIMKAAELLAANPKPSRAEIVSHMNGNICRCGTYNRIIAAIQRASKEA